MSLIRTILISLCALSLFSCSTGELDCVQSKGRLIVQIDPQRGPTRATAARDESTIYECTVFVCTTSGEVVVSASSSGGPVSFELEPAQYRVHVIANVSPSASIRTESDILSQRVNLSSVTEGRIPMYGFTAATVGKTSETVSVQVERMIAKVMVDKVRTDFSGKTVLSQLPFTLQSIYLINVAGDALIGGSGAISTWYNKMGHTSSAVNTVVYDAVNASLASAHQVNHYFYTCENASSDSHGSTWSPRYTRLVFQCKAGEDVFYYAVDLPQIQRNSIYRITDVLIKDWGSTSPDDVVPGAMDVSFTTSLSWDETYNVEEES